MTWVPQFFAESNRNNRDYESSNASRTYLSPDYCLLSKGRNAAFRSTSVYQISRYPSSEKRIEKALRSQSGGTNASNAFGKEILHPGLGGAIIIGTSLATIAARLSSSPQVGSVGAADFPSRITARTGSSWGSLCTCSSESRRNLPGATRKIQASRVSIPRIHGRQSEKHLGKVMRFDVSAVVWTGMSASGDIYRLGFYPILPRRYLFKSRAVNILHILRLTFTQFYRTLRPIEKKFEQPPYIVRRLQWRTKSE
jgi:hypothetical protein